MALLPGYRYLQHHEIVPEGALLDVPGDPLPTMCTGTPAGTNGFYMVPIPKARKVRKYTPPDTSMQAHESQKTKGPADCSRILGLLGDGFNGKTCDEIEVALGMSHQTASARVRDLAQANLILDSGARRKTRTGRNAIIWVVRS